MVAKQHETAEIERIRAIVKALPDCDGARVAFLKDRIASGQYRVDPVRLAEGLLVDNLLSAYYSSGR